MPSYLHEGILQLFRRRPSLASDLLQSASHVELPRHSSARVCSANLTEVRPVEYRADLVVQLVDAVPVLGIIVEVQLSRDPKKKYVWPQYAISLGARLKCPVLLLVVTPKKSVAEWAAKPIDLGNGGAFIPVVIGPSDVPVIDDARQARRDPELAVLSAIAHGWDPDVVKSARIAAAAVRACRGLGAERSGLYFDLIDKSLSEGARRALRKMLPANYQYQSSFARKYYGQGMAKGRAEGRAEGRAKGRVEGRVEGRSEGRAEGSRETLKSVVTRLLRLRFGRLGKEELSRIAAASTEALDAIAERVLSASSLEDALGALGKCARKKKRASLHATRAKRFPRKTFPRKRRMLNGASITRPARPMP